VLLGYELKAYTLSHSTSPFFCDRFFSRLGLSNCLPRLAANSDLCLLSNQDDRREPQALVMYILYLTCPSFLNQEMQMQKNSCKLVITPTLHAA
jgi:hypothetical protein